MNESNQDLININVIIADRPYPLKVKKNEEELIRIAAKSVNEKMKEYQEKYAGKDKQDFLAMIALTLAVDNQKKYSANEQFDRSLSDKLHALDTLLTEALHAT